MKDLSSVLAQVEPRFRRTFEYFLELRGQEIAWPSGGPNGGLPLLASKGKAIFKPRTEVNPQGVALSIRQNLNSSYGDVDPVFRDDGTWAYAYHHEGAHFSDSFTNAALYRNIALQWPVAVLRQVREKPNSRYRVEGLALVLGYFDGFFYLEGFNSEGWARDELISSLVESMSVLDERGDDPLVVGSLDDVQDARVRAIRSIVQRQGQAKFRRGLLVQYQAQCAISGSRIEQLLDAAHILPFRGMHSNELSNGLLLRTDLHSLFDLGLLAVEPESRKVLISQQLQSTEYSVFHGRVIREPSDRNCRPAESNLQEHMNWCIAAASFRTTDEDLAP